MPTRPSDKVGASSVGAEGAPGPAAPPVPSSFAALLADGDATAAVLGFLPCSDLTQLRAASWALRDAVAGCAFPGGLEVRTAKPKQCVDFSKWRVCFPGAVHLRIEDCGGLRDADLAAVGGIVRSMHICRHADSGPPLTDAGFCCLTGLQELDISADGVSITPACFPAFATSLATLKCRSSATSLEVLSRGLTAFTALQSLEADLVPTACPASLRTVHLYVPDNVRLDEAVTRALGAVEDLSIDAPYWTTFSSSLFRPLRRIRRLEVDMRMAHSEQAVMDPSDFGALAAAGIQSLTFWRHALSLPDACLAQLGGGLKELVTTSTCTEDGLSFLTGLETLSFGGTSGRAPNQPFTGACLRHMPRLTKVSFVQLPALTDAGLQSVRDNLVDVALRSCDAVTAAAFAGMSALQSLELDDCPGVDPAALPLAQLPALRWLHFYAPGTVEDAAFTGELMRLGFAPRGLYYWWERARGPGG